MIDQKTIMLIMIELSVQLEGVGVIGGCGRGCKDVDASHDGDVTWKRYPCYWPL